MGSNHVSGNYVRSDKLRTESLLEDLGSSIRVSFLIILQLR